MRYRYVKRVKKNQVFLFSRFLPIFLVAFGLIMLGSATFPILYYQFFTAPRFSGTIKPIPEKGNSEVLGGKTSEVDYTQVSNWFPSAPKLPPKPSKITHYNLSLPRLGIKEAIVQIGGDDLKKSLIQYEGTAFPGQFGNTVIFGHSTLPQFFNPKNYLSIFSTLPRLKKEDEILVDFDGVLYKYVVEEMIEVTPSDISVLEQRYDDSYLTLITCVPPGTYLKRLVVRARLRSL